MLRAATLLSAACLLALAPAASAQAPGNGFALNAELVENFAIGPSSGGRIHGDYFYITTGRELHIYDIKDPEHPKPTGTLLFASPDGPAQRAPEEDPDTNGRVLLTNYGGDMQVYDVADKARPSLITTVPGVSQHTVSCVLDCTWVYGSEGQIVDLRDPRKPVLSKESWVDQQGPSSTHDVTEVAPGILLTSTEPMLLLDARKDPEHPVKLAEAAPPGFVHANLWPHRTGDRMMLAGGEALGPTCAQDKSSTFMTWDTAGWQQSGTFKLIDQFAMSTGTPLTDGSYPGTTFCTHWFDVSPSYRDGGLVAIGWYEDGTRFLKVGTDGKLSEVGYFLPMGSRSSGTYFVTDRIVYVADYYRGFDVVRFTGDLPPHSPAPAPGSAPAPLTPGTPAAGESTVAGASFDTFIKLPSSKSCAKASRFRITVRRSKDPVTSVTVRVGRAKALTVKGAKLKKPIRPRRLPKGRFSLQVQVRTRSGHQTAGQRAYRGCRT